MLLFLIKWLALAYVLEALLITYVPASMIAGLVGGEGIVPIASQPSSACPPISTPMSRRHFWPG